MIAVQLGWVLVALAAIACGFLLGRQYLQGRDATDRHIEREVKDLKDRLDKLSTTLALGGRR